MQMTLRWFGSKYDTVPLKYIRQIPGVTGVISTLYGTAPGEVWRTEEIQALKKEMEDAGLKLCGIESVNIHDAIKMGSHARVRSLRQSDGSGIFKRTVGSDGKAGASLKFPMQFVFSVLY